MEMGLLAKIIQYYFPRFSVCTGKPTANAQSVILFNIQYSIAKRISASRGAYSATFLGPLTLSLLEIPDLISMFKPSLRPVVTLRRS